MPKPKSKRPVKDNEAFAVARTLRVSPQKLNLVAALIRGKKVDKALADLEFSRKRISREVKNALKSAIANAENNHDLDVDELIVSEAYVGKAAVMKRFHARGRGRASRIEKPFSHLTIVVREVSASLKEMTEGGNDQQVVVPPLEPSKRPKPSRPTTARPPRHRAANDE